jgi:hypothetical protein
MEQHDTGAAGHDPVKDAARQIAGDNQDGRETVGSEAGNIAVAIAISVMLIGALLVGLVMIALLAGMPLIRV